ncbi:MAG TPA: hypothetical protein VHH11_08840 [Gammaproteobacteria bacterium]|nr:hypothetical protein [Gammaproteobacteria bacterium]
MHKTLTPAEWQQLEQVTVSTGLASEVADLLMLYREGIMTVTELACAIRDLCQFAHATSSAHIVEFPVPGEPSGALDPA